MNKLFDKIGQDQYKKDMMMNSEMKEQFEKKFSHLITELGAMRETYKAEIEFNSDVEVDIDAGITSLEDAFRRFNRLDDEPEEHTNSSRANSRDYQAEERATTDRGND